MAKIHQALMVIVLLGGCKTTGNRASQTLDHSQGEVVAGQNEIAYYWATGTGPNDQVIRGVCPNGLPFNWQRRREKCSLDTKSVSIATFKERIEAGYAQLYGAEAFTEDMKSVLNTWVGLLASEQTQTDPSRIGPKTSTLLPLMYQAVASSQGHGGSGGGSWNGSLPDQSYAFPGNGIAPEFAWATQGAMTISRLKTSVDAGCPFNLVGITVQTSQGIVPLRSVSFERTGAVWVSDAGPIQTNRLAFSFQGAQGNCHLHVEDGSQDEQSAATQSPPYVMLLLSTQSFLGWMAPNKTHTFAVFAHLDPQGNLIEHVPFSWLPVSTNQEGLQPGQSGLVNMPNNHFQVGRIMTLAGRGRTGWVFSLRETYATVSHAVEGLNIYPIEKATFERAKSWRAEMNGNTTQALKWSQQFGPTISNLRANFLYVADDRSAFGSGCTNAKPAAMNCFHAVAAIADICIDSGNQSGRKASLMVMDAYRARGLVPLMPYSQDLGAMNALIGAAINAEASGSFDRP